MSMTLTAVSPGSTMPLEVPISDPGHRKLFDDANGLLASTTSGRHVADYLDSGKVGIEVYTDEVYDSRYPGTGGSYQPGLNRLNLPESALVSHNYAATLLAHALHEDRTVSHTAISAR